MLATLIAERPRVVSFHFGLPAPERVSALRDAGIVIMAAATSLAEARIVAGAGVDAIVAPGLRGRRPPRHVRSRCGG